MWDIHKFSCARIGNAKICTYKSPKTGDFILAYYDKNVEQGKKKSANKNTVFFSMLILSQVFKAAHGLIGKVK